MLKVVLGVALSGCSLPALAMQAPGQGAVGNPALQPEEMAKPSPASGEVPEGPVALTKDATGDERLKPYLQIDISPDVAGTSPFASDNADQTRVNWTIGATYPLSEHWSLETAFGPSANLDPDRDSDGPSSRLTGVVKLNWTIFARGEWLVQPRLGYRFDHRYGSFFDARDGDEIAADVGMRIQRKFDWATITLDVGSRRFFSTRPERDYWSGRAISRVEIPLRRDSTDLVGGVEVERSWFDGVDSSIGEQRRDRRFEVWAGFNFADAINAYLHIPCPRSTDPDCDRELVDNFTIGARWVDTNSTVPERRSSPLKFTPAISFKLAF